METYIGGFMKDLINRLRNPGTLIGLVGMIGLLLTQFGIQIDLEWLDTTVKIVCSIMTILGLANNPTEKGVYNPIKKV